jgi:hypothetical protein
MFKRFAALPLLLLFATASAFGAPIVGGVTGIIFNSDFNALGLTVTAVSPAVFIDPAYVFPMTGGDTVTPIVFHSGGLELSNGTSVIGLANFTIDPSLTMLGDVALDGSPLATQAPLFTLASSMAVSLTGASASLLNDTFGTGLADGQEIGTAFMFPEVPGGGEVPEPSTAALVMAGVAGLLVARKRARR